MATELTIEIRVKGFEDPLTARVKLEGFEDPLTALEKLQVSEKPLSMELAVKGLNTRLVVNTQPLK